MGVLAEALGPWTWIVTGVVLVGLDMLAPGVFLIWLGFAAILTGLADWALGMSWQGQALAFVVLAIAAVALGRQLTRHRDEEDPSRPALNRRGHNLVGRAFTLDSPIVAGCGRIRVDDSFWRVVGPDAPAGASVRVVRVDGSSLVVEPASGPAGTIAA
jgi:membrane protein implicated in regulation of membrane protease activity